MRDPERIDALLKSIGEVWKHYPDLRLIQLLHNVTGAFNVMGGDGFYYEDDKIMEDIKSWCGGKC